MLTREANERLTLVGPGTPMGNLLRRYWHPVTTTVELEAEPVLAVRLLGENLVLYRNDDGHVGMVAERCPHRGASLAYGIPEAEGLRCPYHGWLFSSEGRCLQQPAEPPASTFHNRIRIPAYPVQEMGGLIWAYLGPQPVPLLPRYDLFVQEHRERRIGISRIPCNWLQVMENSVDPVHLEYLHGKLTNYVMGRRGQPNIAQVRHHERIAFDIFRHGISKRRLLEGQSEDCDEWRVGHPILFPCILAVGDNSYPRFDIRVPVDDTNTLHYWYEAVPRAPGTPEQQQVPVEEWRYLHDNGRIMVETVAGQDIMAWMTQGPNSDRTTERLGTSDQGVILLRSLLYEQMEKVERGEDPLGVLRDPADNLTIEVPREGKAHYVAGAFVPSEQMAVRAELTPTFGRA
ncbi:MAG TPA: Rieske 2Fe-2S domain-containing protein [Dehalococcoidia bacterium]|nr:Rieske 2Fe-2S domain-containing protein [Dehalococcoidia bacterium]